MDVACDVKLIWFSKKRPFIFVFEIKFCVEVILFRIWFEIISMLSIITQNIILKAYLGKLCRHTRVMPSNAFILFLYYFSLSPVFFNLTLKYNYPKPLKKCFLFFISFFLFFSLKAQTNVYFPLPVDSAYWIVTHYEYVNCSGIVEIFNYRIEKDTTINSQTYHVVSRTFNSTYCTYPCCNNDFSYAYLRQDSLNKKVFCIIPSKGINNDSILYDFNLNVGDSIPYGIINSNNLLITVTGIDSFFYEGSYKKQYLLDPANISLIEGIGFTSGLIEPISDFPIDFHVLTCYVNGDSAVGDYPSPAICPLIITGIRENKFTREKIIIFPNPISDFSIIHFSEMQYECNSIIIYNAMGEPVLRKNFPGNEIKINRMEFQPGYYLVEVTSEKSMQKLYVKLIVQ